jgi:hypothetical protein
MDNEMLKMFSQKPLSHPFNDDEIIGRLNKKNKNKGKYMTALLVSIIAIIAVVGVNYNNNNEIYPKGETNINGIAESKVLESSNKDNIKDISKTNGLAYSEVVANNMGEKPKTEAKFKTDTLNERAKEQFRRLKKSKEILNDPNSIVMHMDFDKVRYTYMIKDSLMSQQRDSLKKINSTSYLLPKHNYGSQILPVIQINKTELQKIVPESFEDNKFFILREKTIIYDSIPKNFSNLYDEQTYISRIKYKDGYFEEYDTIIHDWENLSNISNVNKTLYVGFTETNQDFTKHNHSMHISPLVSMWDLYKKELKSIDINLNEYPVFLAGNDDHNMNTLNKYDTFYNNLRKELVPVLYKINPDLHYVLWFIPTDEFIERLPDRYSGTIREQFELFRDISTGEKERGESCIQITDKTDYFGLCGERRGAIENIEFVSFTQSNISAKLKLAEDRKLRFYISTIMGKIVHQENISIGSGSHLVDIVPRDQLERGAYFFVIETEEGEIAIEKVFIE